MPVYEYRGLTPEGRVVAGVIDAENPRGARSKLKRMGVYTTAVQGERATGRLVRRRPWLLGLSRNRIHPREVVVLTRQLATLLSAGLPVIDALTAVLEHADRSGLRRVLTEIRESVREGQSLADALEVHASVFFRCTCRWCGQGRPAEIWKRCSCDWPSSWKTKRSYATVCGRLW